MENCLITTVPRGGSPLPFLSASFPAGMLPEAPDDALIILRLATHLVTDFLLSVDEPAKKPASVVALIGGNERA